MRSTLLGQNPDGSPHYLYEAEEGDGPVIVTGPIVANLTMSDGTRYDATPGVICVAPEHFDEVHHAIGDWYEENGHPLVENFVHDRDATQATLDALKES